MDSESISLAIFDFVILCKNTENYKKPIFNRLNKRTSSSSNFEKISVP